MVELRIEVLGSVRVLRDGAEVDPGGPRQRELLARLAAAGGRPVSFERLAEDLWDDDPGREPRDRRGALATFAGDLRRRLEPGRAPRTAPRVLVTEHGGYALRIPDDALDAARLESAVTRAGERAPGRPGTAGTTPGTWSSSAASGAAPGPAAGAAPSGTTHVLHAAVAAWRDRAAPSRPAPRQSRWSPSPSD